MTTVTSIDRITKEVRINASVSRVWRALTDAREFGAWFGVQLEGDFVAGRPIPGRFLEAINPESIQRSQAKAGLPITPVHIPRTVTTFCTVVAVEPERYFAYRWIPYGVDAESYPKDEPTTLVEFTLEPAGAGTQLTIVESGFDGIPAHRRERAFRMNTGGWTGQGNNLKKYAETH